VPLITLEIGTLCLEVKNCDEPIRESFLATEEDLTDFLKDLVTKSVS
jgi:hypothetical protein